MVPLFNPRRNSIGFLRLLFAAIVIVSHTWPLGGFGDDPGKASNNLGIFAVEGFFALSGFLITRSGDGLGVGRFLWHRVLRIFPAYWVCLVLIAGIAAPAAWVTMHPLAGYVHANPSPFGFVIRNWFLVQGQTSIGDTLASNPFASMWDGPLYTLPFEFLCYIVIAVVAASGLLKPRVIAALAGLVWLWLMAMGLGLGGPLADDRQAKFTLCFLVGSLIYLYRDRILVRSWWRPIAAASVTAATYLTFGFNVVGLFAFSYLVLWAACVIPLYRVGVKHDYSYGMYIYGWPVMQLASLFGAAALGLPVYLLIVLIGTLAFAAPSWYLVERHALKLKNANPPAWLTASRLVPSRALRRRPKPESARDLESETPAVDGSPIK
jgi:peptidoglycan/LPS O-acetylase OafA/YrhL